MANAIASRSPFGRVRRERQLEDVPHGWNGLAVRARRVHWRGVVLALVAVGIGLLAWFAADIIIAPYP